MLCISICMFNVFFPPVYSVQLFNPGLCISSKTGLDQIVLAYPRKSELNTVSFVFLTGQNLKSSSSIKTFNMQFNSNKSDFLEILAPTW